MFVYAYWNLQRVNIPVNDFKVTGKCYYIKVFTKDDFIAASHLSVRAYNVNLADKSILDK